MAVAILRPPRTSPKPNNPPLSPVEPGSTGVLPNRRMRRGTARPAWAGRFVHGTAVALATLLSLRADLAHAVTRASWRRVAPRLAPHAVVLLIVASAVAVGGFRRPDGGLAIPLGMESGALSADARLLLGPRAGEVQVRDALVRPPFSATTLTAPQPRMDVITYTVRAGDTPWDIGARFSVGAWSVLWSNELEDGSIIKPGQQLRIPPVQGVVHTIIADDSLDGVARKYNVDPAAIVDFNGLKPGESLQPDKLLVVPGGALPITPRQIDVAPVAPAPRVQAPRSPLPSLPLPPRPAAPSQQ
ncbi:MAG: LysM peptidoglycan-binding domain-containing protein, partial [Chloroflexota bacterium]|nr:LysM peptidoglycan-binding domain-containing protein [Chloroflexota bacterium]